MGKIILCTSHEKNVGVTSISLILGKSISDMLQKKVLAVDLNINNPEFYKILAMENGRTAYNIDTVMSYAMTEDIDKVIKGNVEYLNNSNLELLMGTNMKTGYKEQQYVKFLYAVSKMYEFILVDCCLDSLDQTVIDYSDMILYFINPSFKMVNDAKDIHWKLIKNDKTFLVVNRYEEGVIPLKKVTETLKKNTCYKIHYGKNIISCINKGDLNIGESNAQSDINYISTEILNRYHMLTNVNWWIKFLSSIKGGKSDAVTKG